MAKSIDVELQTGDALSCAIELTSALDRLRRCAAYEGAVEEHEEYPLEELKEHGAELGKIVPELICEIEKLRSLLAVGHEERELGLHTVGPGRH